MKVIGISVYKHMGLVTADVAEANRPQEYGHEAQKRAGAIGKMLGNMNMGSSLRLAFV